MAESLIFESFCMRSEISIATSANATVIMLPHTNVFIYFKTYAIKLINLIELQTVTNKRTNNQ
jgi:hypothetical protein